MQIIKKGLAGSRKQFYLSLAATFIWGLFAHGYAFANNHVTHDSLREFHGEILGNQIKMGSGRVLTPVYRDLLGTNVTLPWMIGLLALLWIGLAVYLMVRLFRVESPAMIALMAGVCTVNIAVSSTAATYIHDLDCYMFSMLCAVTAVFLWRSHSHGWIIGAAFAAVSLGIYQSFLFVAVTLIIMVCVLDLLNEKFFRTVMTDGLKSLAMLALGGLLYYLIMKVILALTGVALTKGDYNSLDRALALSASNLIPQVLSAYEDWFSRLMDAYCSYPSILVKGFTAALLAVCAVAVGLGLLNRKLTWKERALCVLLVILLPLGMNMIHVLTVGKNHDLMTFPIWLLYVFALLLADWMRQKLQDVKLWGNLPGLLQIQRMFCMVMVLVIVYGNAWFANGMYMKKGLEHEAYMSLMTRVISRMEAVEEYVPGETEVVFVGLPENLNEVMPGFKDYWNVTGMTKSDMIYAKGRDRFQAYFDYMMGLPVVLAEEEIWNTAANLEIVQQMPAYPARDSIQMVDGILLVKLGD